MDVVTLLSESRRAGLTVEANGDGLYVEGPTEQRELVKQLQESKAEILKHLNGEPVESTEPATATVEPYKPFPVDVLPTAIGNYVRSAADAIGCDYSFCADCLSVSAEKFWARFFKEIGLAWPPKLANEGSDEL